MEIKILEKITYSIFLIIVCVIWVFVGLDTDDLINASLMAVLCIGFTFTYMIEGFPNLAHTSYAIIGAITSFYLVRFHGINPYYTWPFSVFVGGLLGVFLYITGVRIIKQRGGNQSITLTFFFLAIAIALGSCSSIFSYWVSQVSYSKREYNLSMFDFQLLNYPGITYIGVGVCILITIYLYYFLKKTLIGTSIRAVAENEELAQILGINTFRVHSLAWFISGGLSSLAGSIIVLHQGISPQGADTLLVAVMTGAIWGGLDTIYGAVLGGVFIAIAQKVLSSALFWVFGKNVLVWTPLYPLMFLIVTLIFFPEGILNKGKFNMSGLRKKLRSLK